MAIQIATAISKGFSNSQILKHIAKQYPQYANQINNALAVGYTANSIVKHLATPKEGPQFKTAFQKYSKGRREGIENREKAALAAIGTAGAVAAGGMALMGGTNAARAVRPSQILAAPGRQAAGNIAPGQQPPIRTYNRPQPQQKQLPQTPPPIVTPYSPKPPQGQLPPPPQGQLPAPPPGKGPRGRQPSGPLEPIATPYEVDPQQSFKLVKSLGVDKQIDQAISSGLQTHVVAQVLRETLPRNKTAVLEKAPGGIEKALEDYSRIRQSELQAQPRTEALQKFNQVKGKQPTIREQELARVANSGFTPQPEVDQPQVSPEQEAYEEQMAPPGMASPMPLGNVNQQVQQAAKAVKHPSAEGKSLESRKESFYVPNYVHPGESKEEFNDRKILYDAINKGAKALMEGKSFRDFPLNPITGSKGYSTAADVLKFIAGIPNVYEELLDDSEKDEIQQAVEGDRDYYGAHMTPNLIWNLMLSVEPRISSMIPKSIKGAKGKPPGGKMGTTEMRRFLTHGVYNVLSGKKISSELADKIGKISRATEGLDVMIKACKAGNDKKMMDEMERLATDDEYFMQIMKDEALDMLGARP